jgi:RNA polymerase sigma-70 factor, ECF subfamily
MNTTELTPVSDADAKSFQTARPRLFRIAYRILGCKADADDVVQDAWLRWQRTDRSTVRDPGAFLATTTTRLSINRIQLACTRREIRFDPRLPEPADGGIAPPLQVEQIETLDRGVRVLLERLLPAERAAYVLREAFEYPYRQIAEVLGLSDANARQLAARARKHIPSGRRRSVDATEHRRLLEAIVAAAQTGDLPALEALLTADIASWRGPRDTAPVRPLPTLAIGSSTAIDRAQVGSSSLVPERRAA